jgi:glycosyltransferase involved in cell wall biosynthesis
VTSLKLLIVTNLHHSSPRIPGIARYLPEHGVQVTVVAPRTTGTSGRHGAPPADAATSVRLVETGGGASVTGIEHSMAGALGKIRRTRVGMVSGAVRKLVSLYREVAWFPDRDRRWVPHACRAAADLLSRERFDVLLTSSSPVSCHVVGRRLKRRFGLPWVAEFRDLWSQNHAYPYSVLRRWIERRFEKRTMSSADVLVTVADALASKLRRLHGKPTHVIYNGFDGAVYRNRVPLTPEFTITYTGQIYPGKQNPGLICRAIRELIDGGEMDPRHLVVRFFGPFSEALAQIVSSLDLEGIVGQRGLVSPLAASSRQMESQLLLTFNWEDSTEKGLYSQKIFEYLGARRPILATGGWHGHDVREELIDSAGAGRYCTTVEEVKAALRVWYQEYREHTSICSTTNESVIRAFEYQTLAGRYGGIIERALAAGESASK